MPGACSAAPALAAAQTSCEIPYVRCAAEPASALPLAERMA